jgi:hypothetical protein
MAKSEEQHDPDSQLTPGFSFLSQSEDEPQ